MLLHAQPIYGFLLIPYQEVCEACIICSGPRAASPGLEDAENGEWAELTRNVPLS